MAKKSKGLRADQLPVFFICYLCGAGTFIVLLIEGKITYLLVGFFVFIASYLLRKYITKPQSDGVGEYGVFLGCYLLVGYFISFLSPQNPPHVFLPEYMFLNTAHIFIILFFISLLDKFLGADYKKNLGVIGVFLVGVFLVLNYQEIVISYSQQNSVVKDIIIGSPLFYLLYLLTGVSAYAAKVHTYMRRLYG